MAEEREPLLPTTEQPVDSSNSVTNGQGVNGNSHQSKVAKVKQCIAKNGIVAFAATLVAVGVIVFGAAVLTSELYPPIHSILSAN